MKIQKKVRKIIWGNALTWSTLLTRSAFLVLPQYYIYKYLLLPIFTNLDNSGIEIEPLSILELFLINCSVLVGMEITDRVYERIEKEKEEEEIINNSINVISNTSGDLALLGFSLDEQPRKSGQIPNGCSSCKYLHGKGYGGNLLVCASHPYGQEDCADFSPEKIIKITHHYSFFPNSYAVKTKYSIEELNQICACLQVLRHNLPDFKTIEDNLFRRCWIKV